MKKVKVKTTKPRWTREQVRTLKLMYRTASNEDIANAVSRNTSSITFKAFRLGLRKSPRRLREMGQQNISKRWGKRRKK